MYFSQKTRMCNCPFNVFLIMEIHFTFISLICFNLGILDTTLYFLLSTTKLCSVPTAETHQLF